MRRAPHDPPLLCAYGAAGRSLDHLMMSHNNVGRRGAKAVFMALRQRARSGVELLVDMQSCELGSDTGDDLFDMYSPSGRCVRLQMAPSSRTNHEETVSCGACWAA